MKQYLSDLIGDEYIMWGKRKVILTAPTGMGKSTFILKVLLPYLRKRGKKLLILCNRRLLRMQYWFDLVRQYDSYAELESSVGIMTYQQLADDARKGKSVERLFECYQMIVCDEAHFFYCDSDFNGFGTFALLQIIVNAGINKGMIFMSATMNETALIIRQTIVNCLRKTGRGGKYRQGYYDCGQIVEKDYSAYEDFERFQCICVPDEDTLCGLLAESTKKSVLFIDNKNKGNVLKEILVKTKKVGSNDIVVLNSENIDESANHEVVRRLAIGHRVVPKILITTAVLDNGVSIHDSDVGNVAIITESKVSFLQMLGRVRAGKVDRCNLYFICRQDSSFLLRMNQYEKDCRNFEELDKRNVTINPHFYLEEILNGSDVEKVEFYRRALVWMRHDYQCFILPNARACGVYGDSGIYVNEFARRKIGDMYLAESQFYSMAVEDPIQVVYEQMCWIGKAHTELQMQESEYHEIRRKKFIQTLLTVQGFTQEELQKFKRDLVKEFRNEFFPDILANNGTLSSEKFASICEKFGLVYRTQKDSESRKNVYFIEGMQEVLRKGGEQDV